MALYTQALAKANVRNRDGKRVFYLGQGDILTASARDWLNGERIPIEPAAQAKPEFYVTQEGERLEEKPEHMTHLNGNVLVEKTHPRIAFRGKMDTLEAELLLAQRACSGLGRKRLQEALDLAREIVKHDVLDTPLPPPVLDGLGEAELRLHSHFPQKYYHQPHFMPSGGDSLALLQINRARTAAREAELACCLAFGEARPDLVQGLNRLSSYLWILIIRCKAGKLGQ